MSARSYILLFLLVSASVARAQVDQIQAVVSGPVTGQVTRTLTDHLSVRPGVLLCRIDPVSRNVLLHVDPSFHLNEEALRKLFLIHGLHLRCFIRTPRTNTPFHLLDPRACGEPRPIR